MNRTLVLFAKGFPYQFSEPFLEHEYPLYPAYFDQVLIVTGCRRGDTPTRDVKPDSIRVIPDYTLSKDLWSMLEAVPFVLTDPMFYREIWALLRAKRFSAKRLYQLLVIALCGNHRALLAMRQIRRTGARVDVIYSYWLDIPAYAAVRLRRMLRPQHTRIVSRCHGFDIFCERKQTDYLPCLAQLLKSVDHVAAASKAAQAYLLGRYEASCPIGVSYVGCRDQKKENPLVSRDVLRIVSCARVVPGKRLERLVDALAHMNSRKIIWTHIGGGAGLGALEAYAKRKLPANVNAEFMGAVPNAQVYALYASQPFHVFVTTSVSEGGTPVSICEAGSFHIPAVGTAVGGIGEFIDSGVNGLLIEKDFEDAQLIGALETIATMTETAYRRMRMAARVKFHAQFDAYRNNRRLIETCLLRQED